MTAVPPTISRSASSPTDSTRERILKVALDLFGQFGFAAVSVRQICDEADVNVAAINYHFEGKDNLYTAVDEYISAEIEKDMLDVFVPAREFVNSDCKDKRAAIEHLIAIHTRLTELIVPDSGESERLVRFYLRNQLGEGKETVCDAGEQIQMLVVALIGIARDGREDHRTNAIFAATLFGQILVFRVERTSVLKMLKINSLSSAEVIDIASIVRRNIRAMLVH